MREKPFQTVLFLFSLVLLAPAAFAHPLKPSHATGARKTAHAEALRANAHARSMEAATAQKRRTHLHPTMPAAGRSQNRAIDDRPINRHSRSFWVAGNHGNVMHRQAPAEPARVEPRVDPPPAESTLAELPPIEVHHNRKLHRTPDAAAPEIVPEQAPRKATIQDFLETPAAPAKNNTAPASPLSTGKPAPQHQVSMLERQLPVAKAATVVVPDPVTEPVLYTARGRLIVPPALKGSHGILLHQNEMADRDGLIRVQDDDDLDRLRASKQLVALPASSALEVEEHLPVNRRYCRPWTAQFLAAIARAHYARFHSPLQVNSAVRTVEFQERLRYTNGNAAPAEGETASPHLTGQAIDLAKHGLSMTEIAWLRGYLMPLVQQGKVDVEEEFQQSCFHISVYKAYLPQPTPKREISTHRTPTTALATAIR
jgi:hypothetical protein